MGLGLTEIPFDFGWDLVIWEPFGVQFGSGAILGPNKTGLNVVDVLDDRLHQRMMETLTWLGQKQGLSLFLRLVI